MGFGEDGRESNRARVRGRERERGRNGDIVNNCSRRIVLIFYRAIVTVVLLFASRPWHGYGLAWHGISQQRATTLGRTQYDYADSSSRDTAYFNYHINSRTLK